MKENKEGTMKHARPFVVLAVAVFMAAALVSAPVYSAYAPPEQPPDVGGQGAGNISAGWRLEGDLILEWYNIDEVTLLADAKVILQLRHGNDENTFTGEITDFPLTTLITDPTFIQGVIDGSVTDVGGKGVLEYFFGDDPVEAIVVKQDLVNEDFSDGSSIVFVHLVIAVK
jgi:hypothetical protein